MSDYKLYEDTNSIIDSTKNDWSLPRFVISEQPNSPNVRQCYTCKKCICTLNNGEDIYVICGKCDQEETKCCSFCVIM